MQKPLSLALLFLMAAATAVAADEPREQKPQAADPPDYTTKIAPIFRKYCNGCHDAETAEGELALDSFPGLLQGGTSGAVIVPGDVQRSRLIRVLEKQAEPFMPPEGSEGPKPSEIELLKAWIHAGAKGPTGEGPDPTLLVTPNIAPTGEVRDPIGAVACSPDGQWLVCAHHAKVKIHQTSDRKRVKVLDDLHGHVNDVGFSNDGTVLYAASGEAGLFGEVQLWDTSTWKRLRTIRGHRDCLYAAALSPDGQLLATGSYDQKIKLWQVESGVELRTLDGHNGAVFDLAFHPNGKILASASGDRTVKLWDVQTGQRLDTFVEPEQAQYTVAFSPDGRHIAAGGVDHRVRIWQVSPTGQEGTNSILYSRFGHEAPILKLKFSPDGRALVSSAEDRTIKVWETDQFTPRKTFADQPDWAPALAFPPDSAQVIAGRLDGSLATYPIAIQAAGAAPRATPIQQTPLPQPHEKTVSPAALPEVAEVEPNDAIESAVPLSIPARGAGVLDPSEGHHPDVDLYRFDARAGQTWIIETRAARQQSPADTKIEILHDDGRPVERLLFRAVRDSYITFRPIDSQTRDVRVKNWEEMDLNQFLYLNGEVCKIFRMPQGPDSGLLFYGINGKRACYFDTSATIHAKEDPIYVVEAYPTGTKLVDNGLPVFTHYYANDDDGERKLGSDSRLSFTAPADGSYLLRVTDVRGFGGPDFQYTVSIREPRPDFQVTLDGQNPKVPAGSGQRITVKLDRIDNFNGPVRVDFATLPPGFRIATPVVVPTGHREAQTVLYAAADARQPTQEQWEQVQITATATIHQWEITQEVGNLGKIELQPQPKILVTLEPDRPSGDEAANELVIAPGTMTNARLRIERNGFDGEINFDVDNLPHGVIVADIGLNGILIREGETERRIYVSAAEWVPETTRWIHAVSKSQGNQASPPIAFHVRRSAATAKATPPESRKP